MNNNLEMDARHTSLIILFLDADGYPVSPPAEFEIAASGIVNAEFNIPPSAGAARAEIPLSQGVIVRRAEIAVDGEKMEIFPQNAAGEYGGDLFISSPPRYITKWNLSSPSRISFSADIAPVAEHQAVSALLAIVEGLKHESALRDAELYDLRHALEEVHGSNAWHAVCIYYRFKDIVKMAVYTPTKFLRALAKLFFKLIPLPKSSKLKLKNYALSHIGIAASLSLSGARYTDERLKEAAAHFLESERISVCLDSVMPLEPPPGSIAVHLHLFYLDLLDEFFDCLSRIPYPFDLYVSIVSEEDVQEVIQGFTRCGNIQKIRVAAVPNRGRDTAPMISEFGSELAEYDYILHIHSKKSPHLSGAFDWRGYLLRGLMRDEIHVRRLFNLFEQYPKLGIIYPEAHSEIPYWTLTALVNEPEIRRLFSYIGIEYPETGKYEDFPVGTMFWARGAAIKKLLASGISPGDFPEEAGQLDGTLSHAVEHGLGMIVSSSGYIPAQISADCGAVNIGPGLRNFDKYLAEDASGMEKRLSQFKHASFGIFGTLVCSDFESREALWQTVERELGRPFAALRGEAELNSLCESSAPDIHNIYMWLRRLSGMGADECERAKALEFEILAKNCRPRAVAADIFKKMSEQGYDVVLAEDTVWPSAYITKILSSCGVSGWRDIYLSSESGRRKSDGSMYGLLSGRFKGKPFIHVGCHELHDIQIANDNGIPAFHVMHPRDMLHVGMLDESYFGRCRDNPFCLPELMREKSDASRELILHS